MDPIEGENSIQYTGWMDSLEDETSLEDEGSTKRTDPHIYMKISDGYIPQTNSHDEILTNP